MPDLDPTPNSADVSSARPDGAPPPRDLSGLIAPTLVGMVAGVGVILLLLWLTS